MARPHHAARCAHPMSYLWLMFFLAVGTCSAIEQTQTITLAQGWNSVWLSVEPQDADGNPEQLDAVFITVGQGNVRIVSTLLKPVGTADFSARTSGVLVNQEKWGVWRAQNTSKLGENGENTLTTMPGNRGYLIYAKNAVTITINGEASFQTPTWQPDSYNLIGFNLLGSPTFDELFAEAGTRHPINKIFKLQANGDWTGVQATDTMAENTAYMIYANGRSDFMGAVNVRPGRSLDFGTGPGTIEFADPAGDPDHTILLSKRELTFTNSSQSFQGASISKVTAPDDADDLHLFDLFPSQEGLDWAIGSGRIDENGWGLELPPGTNKSISIGALRNETDEKVIEGLYRIELGTHYYWLPATAENSQPQVDDGVADPAYVGLWIGDAIVDTVSSITEAGAPQKPTSSKAPVRVLIHVDNAGEASLLSHVLLMQTKTADADTPSEPVLVIDEAKIPNFEGIEERRGKRVGRRFETTSYDMPRKADATTQAALYADQGGITNEATFTDWLNAQDPSNEKLALRVEAYHLSWPLTGGFGPAVTVRTPESAPLQLDAFHRSNPFRHAFHPKHGAGIGISRTISISFDPKQSADRMTGTYEETLNGLTNDELTVRGRITLQRLTTVGELQ